MKIIYYSADPEKTPASGYWDQALLSDILSKPVFKNMYAPKGAIFVVPGAYQGDHVKKINEELSKYKWVLLFITSDEESKFPVEDIKHPNIKIYVQYPKKGRHDQYGKLPLGYTTETRKSLVYAKKDLDIFYSGQKSHERRVKCSEALYQIHQEGRYQMFVSDTSGFSQGMTPSLYQATMCNAKIAPCPAGPISADSFRLYEALEAGAIPIGDNESIAGDKDYWNYLFGSVPFPTISNYESLSGYVEDILEDSDIYKWNALVIQAWWIKKKRDLMWQFVKDIENLGWNHHHSERITAIIPVSPIKSHPSIEILSETVKSIRHHLPEAEIIITFDGVRAEQADRMKDYYESIRKALYMCNTEWNAVPMLFKAHTHQVGMARVALEQVKTETILYCEQDTPLVTDYEIPFDELWPKITLFEANIIRFHFEARIPDEHQHLMLAIQHGNLLETIQWSQRPHLASTSFYKYILEKNFSEDARCFIEDKLHSVVQQDYKNMGYRGWELWKLFIYYPDPENIKRSLNLDGRAGGAKYDETQIF